MVDFRQNSQQRKPTPNYLSRREQKRLLLLVATLGLVVYLMFQAAQPANWAWLWSGAGVGSQQQTASQDETPEFYDTRLRPSSPEQLPLDTFIAPAEKQAEVDVTGSFFPGVKPELLATIRDHTVFRYAETEAWYNLLNTLDGADEAALERASVGQVGFLQLYEQPGQYRGQVVTVEGLAMRAFDLQAPKNEHGIESYYQLWLNPAGGPTSPIVIYALDVPDGFPTSRVEGSDEPQNIFETIRVTGIFFKNWAYAAGETIHSAPLLVAKTVDWEPVVVVEREPVEQTAVGLVIGIGAVIGLAVAGIIYWTSRGKGSTTIGALAARYQAGSPENLEEHDHGPDVGETLRALAEQAEVEDSGASASPSSGEAPPVDPSANPHEHPRL